MNKAILNDALALSVNERVELVDRLLESLDAPNEEINKIWSTEAESRFKAYDEGKVTAQPVSEVLKKYK